MSVEFKAYQDRVYDMTGKVAKAVMFQVTEQCNLNCSYCYQINKGNLVMKFETAKKFIDKLLAEENGFREYLGDDISTYIFDFIGGEPFLEVELIDKICDYIIMRMLETGNDKLDYIRFSISSNGINYFDEKVQKFLKKYKNLLAFSISIDGNKELHDSCRVFSDGSGSYDIAIKGVRDYMSKGYAMGSKMTLAPKSVDKTANAVISLINEGYKDVRLNCVYEEGWTLCHARTLYYELKKLANYIIDNKLEVTISMFNNRAYMPLKETDNNNWCGGNGAMIAVDTVGNIYPCIRYMASSLGNFQKPLIIGDVENGILQTKEQRKIDSCLKCITRKSQSTNECFNCPVASGCAWCTAYNYQVTGNPNKRLTYICDMHKATSLANVYYWNKKGVPFKMNLSKEDAIRIVGEEEYKRLKELEEQTN